MRFTSAFRSTILFLTLSSAACGGDTAASSDASVMDRETFIATYVDLRAAVIRGESHELSDQERIRILSDHGITEAEFTDFVEVHGEDVAFMRGVWDEIEARLDAMRLVPGSSDPASPDPG
jgi:hypothetical protein